MKASPEQAKEAVRLAARGLGFADCRVAPAAPAPRGELFTRWLEEGWHGDMEWLARDPARRLDPREVLPGCRAVVCLALDYFPGEESPNAAYRIARYAWGDDYHDLIGEKLRDLDLLLQDFGGTQRCYTDTGPVLERDFASLSGLGWNGKSTVQIHRRLGAWFFLAEVLTTLPLPPDPPAREGGHCGKCAACVKACPTGAITAPGRVDARRCLSYLTIEHKGAIPEELRPLTGDRLYGCDDCLEACPWNRFAEKSRHLRLHARKEVFEKSLADFLALGDAEFRALFAKSPVKRLKRPRFLRNVCVVLGNTGTRDDLPALRRAAADSDPLVAEHAAWAARRIEEREGLSPLKIS